jgi:hypothetical protein
MIANAPGLVPCHFAWGGVSRGVCGGPMALAATLLALVSVVAQPDNDDFSRRTPLLGSEVIAIAYTLDATMELAEPDHSGSGSTRASVWYSWTAPRSGHLKVHLLDEGSLGAHLVVYRGDQLPGIVEVSRAAGLSTGFFPVSVGVRYAIVLAEPEGAAPAASPAHPFRLRFVTEPVNDAFADRTIVGGWSNQLLGWLVAAAHEPGEPAHGGEAAAASVWWSWTAPADGWATLHDPGASGSTAHAVYRGDVLTELTPVTVSDGHSFEARSNEVYQIAFYAVPGEPLDEFRFNLGLSTFRLVSPPYGVRYVFPGLVPFELLGLPGDWPHPVSIVQLAPLNPNAPRQLWTGAVHSMPAVLSDLLPGEYRVRAESIDSVGSLFASPPIVFALEQPGDRFADAQLLSGVDIEVAAEFRGAALEPDEPPAPAGSLWWFWTAPSDGVVRLIATELEFDLFTGAAWAALTPIELEDEPGFQAARVNAGVTYRIRAAPRDPPQTIIHWRLRFLSVPDNDGFAGQLALLDPPGSLDLALAAATLEPGEPNADLIPDAVTVWYSWTPTAAGQTRITVTQGEEQASASAWRGEALHQLESVAGPGSFLEFRAEPGLSYAIQILGSRRALEAVQVSYVHVPFPLNDSFAMALELPSTEGSVQANNELAGTEPGDPAGERTVWFSWNAPEDGNLELRLQAAWPVDVEFEPVLSIWTGDRLEGLVPIPHGPLLHAAEPALVHYADVEAGVNYSIAVAGVLPADFVLGHVFRPRATNDAFHLRTPLEGTPLGFSGATWGAGRETFEPKHLGEADGRSIWWAWTAPRTGWVVLTALPSNAVIDPTPPNLAVYQGTLVDRLFPIAGSSTVGACSQVSFSVEVGQTYHFAVDQPRAAADPHHPGGEVELELDLTTLQILQPLSNEVITQPTKPTLAVNQPSPDIDGELVSVDYWRVVGPDVSPVPLGQGTNSSFTLADVELPPGRHLVFATATNLDGGVRVSPPRAFRLAPSNDAFTGQLGVTGAVVQITGTCAGASREVGEPLHGGNLAGASVWYRWRAPGNGVVFLQSQNPVHVTAYTGSDLGRLRLVGSAATPGTLEFSVFSGHPYLIAVDDPRAQEPFFSETFTLNLGFHTVVLHSPAGTDLPQPDQLRLEASTTESTAGIASITFRLRDVPMVTLTSPPFEWVWMAPPAGAHRWVADLLLESGEIISSPPLDLLLRPRNGTFESRSLLTGQPLGITNSTAGASAAPALGLPNPTVWYTWTPSGPGLLQLSCSPSNMGVAVFRGESLEQLQPLTNGLTGDWLPATSAAFVVDGPTPCQIAVTTLSSESEAFVLELAFSPPPANDAFDTAFALTGRFAIAETSNLTATREPGEPDHGQATLWWSWNPPVDGTARVRVDADGFLPAVWAYAGESITTLEPSGGGEGTMEFEATAGTTYRLAVGVIEGQAGAFALELALVYPPPHDDFHRAEPLPWAAGEVAGWNDFATREPFEPSHAGIFGGRSVWYSWRAPDWGIASISLDGELTPSAVLAVYTGELVAGLSQVVAGMPGGSSLEFATAPGQIYRIAVDGQFGNTGTFTLGIEFTTVSEPLNLTIDSEPGQLRIRLGGLDQGPASLETSVDLISWTLDAVVPAGNDLILIRPLDTDQPRLFYRLRPLSAP